MNTFIGLEIHVELSTFSKMFCACSANHFLVRPNTNVCPVCMGFPGALPYPNQKALESTIKIALALGADISQQTNFDRKHYFYPDLPKSYQISQLSYPIGLKGKYLLGSDKNINIRRIHLEEDTGKLIHTLVNSEKVSLIDFNRSGVPLVEIVTEPDFNNTLEVLEFLRELQLIIRYLDVSTADMEKGSLRLEANVSISENITLPKYKVELKNINSFKYLEGAINYELERQKLLILSNKKPISETRGYDEKKRVTFSQRIKEESMDYRYFPEPDIPTIYLNKKYIQELKQGLPELPNAKRLRFQKLFGLNKYASDILVSDKYKALFFEKLIALDNTNNIGPITISNYLINSKLNLLNEDPVKHLSKLISLKKKIFISDADTERTIDKILLEFPDLVEKFHNGKYELIGYFMGLVQKQLQGKGSPETIRRLLEKKLKSS